MTAEKIVKRLREQLSTPLGSKPSAKDYAAAWREQGGRFNRELFTKYLKARKEGMKNEYSS